MKARHTGLSGRVPLPHVVIDGRVFYVWQRERKRRSSGHGDAEQAIAESVGRDVADYVLWWGR